MHLSLETSHLVFSHKAMDTPQRLTPQPNEPSTEETESSQPTDAAHTEVAQLDPQLISQQRVRYIVDSYTLAGSDNEAFEDYLKQLFVQYPYGLIELALVETLVKNWLVIPMEKGVPFLTTAHEKLKQWQQSASTLSLTPNQFFQITNLDPQLAFDALTETDDLAPQPVADPA